MADRKSFDFTLTGIMMIALPSSHALAKYFSDEPILLTELLVSAPICLVTFGLLEFYRTYARTWGFWGRFTLAATAGVTLLASYKYFFGSPAPWQSLILAGAALGLTPAILVMWARSKDNETTNSNADAE
jgi:uncharacterized membrane-anchored protein